MCWVSKKLSVYSVLLLLNWNCIKIYNNIYSYLFVFTEKKSFDIYILDINGRMISILNAYSYNLYTYINLYLRFRSGKTVTRNNARNHTHIDYSFYKK